MGSALLQHWGLGSLCLLNHFALIWPHDRHFNIFSNSFRGSLFLLPFKCQGFQDSVFSYNLCLIYTCSPIHYGIDDASFLCPSGCVSDPEPPQSQSPLELQMPKRNINLSCSETQLISLHQRSPPKPFSSTNYTHTTSFFNPVFSPLLLKCYKFDHLNNPEISSLFPTPLPLLKF